MMDKSHLEAMLKSEIERQTAVRGAAETLQRQLGLIDEGVEALRNLLRLGDEERDMQEPIVAALGSIIGANGHVAPTTMLTPVPSAAPFPSTNSPVVTEPLSSEIPRSPRTIGKRIFNAIASYLNVPHRQSANVARLYAALPDDLRVEWESIRSEHDALFRFRRLLRGNKEDYDVARGSGLITYLRYHPEPGYDSGFPSPPSPDGKAVVISVVARRFSETTNSWRYRFHSSQGREIREMSFASLVDELTMKNAVGVTMRTIAGRDLRLTAFKLDGVNRIASYEEGHWTMDFDYQLRIAA